MKKSLVTILTLLFILGSLGGAYAAGDPFVDVPQGHWSYNAVKKLAADGIIEGDGNGMFNGDKALTRYEFAVIITRAIAREDKASAEDKALIEKLVTEYKAELSALNSRLQKLEEKTSRMQIYGDTRLRYASQLSGTNYVPNSTQPDDSLPTDNTYNDQDINLDLHYSYAITQGWSVNVESEWQRQINAPDQMNTAGLKKQAEQLYLTGPWAGGTLNLGKYRYVPAYGLTYDSTIQGAQYSFGDVFKTTVTWGHTNTESEYSAGDVVWTLGKDAHIKAAVQKVWATPTTTNFTYIYPNYGNYYEAGFDTKVANDLVFTAAAAKADQPGVTTNDKAYYCQLQYKVANLNVVGSNDVFVNYYKIPSSAAYDRSDAEDDTSNYVWDITKNYAYGADIKGSHIGFDYVPAKNTKITVWYLNGKDADTGTKTLKVLCGQFAVFF